MNLTEKQVEQYSSLIEKRIESMTEDWQQPWINTQAGKPRNLDGRVYDYNNGLNSIMLSMHTQTNGYTHPVYTTFLRAKEEGIRIQAGEQGIPVAYKGFSIKDKETNQSISHEDYIHLSPEEKDKYNINSFVKVATVFNLDQTNIKTARPELWEKIDASIKSEKENLSRDNSFIHESLGKMIQDNNWIIPIKHSSDSSAYYAPSAQIIHLPEQNLFKSNAAYYATALHEMAHSTEVPLKRDISNYGREELVAELSASIVASRYNYPKEVQDSNVQYLKAWLENMQKDPSFLKNVLEDVHKTSNFITKEIDTKYNLIAEIDYIAPSGDTAETMKFYNEEKFLSHVKDAQETGVPFQYRVLNDNKELEDKARLVRAAALGYSETEEQAIEQALQQEVTPPKVETKAQETIDKEFALYLGAKNQEDKSLMKMYANPHLMTPEFMTDNGITDKELLRLVEERRDIIKNYSITEQPGFLIQKELIEDKIRNQAKDLYDIPELPTRAQKEDFLTQHIERVTQEPISIDKQKLVDTATYKDITLVVKEPNTPENVERLKRDGVDFQQNGSTLSYEARIRYREGFAMDNNLENKDILSDLKINYIPYGKDKLFIPSTEEHIGELTYHTDKIMPIYGVGTLPKLKENNLEERLKNNPSLTAEDRQALLSGQTVFRPDSMDSDANKVYYIDKNLHQIRTIATKDLFVPKELSAVPLREEQIKELKEGKSINFFDQANHVHYKAQIDMRELNNIKLEYRTALNEEFKQVPTVQSPDHEKEKYIALKGGTGINDIWGREGLKMERDTFLEKYKVQEAYREFLLLSHLREPGLTINQNKEIKEAFQKEEQQQNRTLHR